MLDIIHMIRSGGIFMYGILAASFVAISVIVQRLYTLWILYRLDIEALRDQVVSYIDQGEFGRPFKMSAAPIHCRRFWLRHFSEPTEARRISVAASKVRPLRSSRACGEGQRHCPSCPTWRPCSVCWETIHGLIISFSGMQGIDAAARQAALSKGVAVAFYNTFFGLTVATVTVVAYLIVFSKQTKELTRIEAATSTVIDHLLTSPEARSGARGAGR